MRILFGTNPQIILSLFSQNESSHFMLLQLKDTMYLVHMHLLLQFYGDSFETLHVFRLWSEDVHIILI